MDVRNKIRAKRKKERGEQIERDRRHKSPYFFYDFISDDYHSYGIFHPYNNRLSKFLRDTFPHIWGYVAEFLHFKLDKWYEPFYKNILYPFIWSGSKGFWRGEGFGLKWRVIKAWWDLKYILYYTPKQKIYNLWP